MPKVLKKANTESHYKITCKDLPLSCPGKQMRVWDAHPKVYLPIKAEAGAAVACPYCGAKYTFVE